MMQQPMSKQAIKAGNAMMIERIQKMPVQPYQEEKGVYRIAEMRGRQSGLPRRVPLAISLYKGELYLIAPDRKRDWVQNLIAAGECILLVEPEDERYYTLLTLDNAAIDAVSAYTAELADWALQQFPFNARASEDEIRSKGEDFAVFRLIKLL